MKIMHPGYSIISNNDYNTMLTKIESIGRVCYKSEKAIKPGSAEKFIEGLLKRGHESVIEHEAITVKIICDRGVSHEVVRHRIASYSQESTRYCNYSIDKFGNEISCIDPSTGFHYNLNDPTDAAKFEIWNQAMLDAERHYFELIQAGARPEEARSVLPNSLKTELVITMNIREWRHFFRLRTDTHAHPQIVEISSMLLKEFSVRYPVFFADLL